MRTGALGSGLQHWARSARCRWQIFIVGTRAEADDSKQDQCLDCSRAAAGGLNMGTAGTQRERSRYASGVPPRGRHILCRPGARHRPRRRRSRGGARISRRDRAWKLTNICPGAADDSNRLQGPVEYVGQPISTRCLCLSGSGSVNIHSMLQDFLQAAARGPSSSYHRFVKLD